MTEIEKLALRCEAATGPDIALDSDIHSVVSSDRKHPYIVGTHIDDTHPSGRPYSAPAYSASLDAAMSLVPEGWFYEIESKTSSAVVWKEPGPTPHTLSEAATPALALCVAALRARGSTK